MTTRDLRGDWELAPGESAFRRDSLIPDPMGWVSPGASCRANSPARHWVCTRLLGHTGRHAASTGEFFLAVWS